jgi:hypothetical protein
MKAEVQKIREPQQPQVRLERLEQAIHSELGALSQGVKPLLDEVRTGVAALFPEPGGTRLAPKEHEARHEKLLGSLEEVLEALQLAARSGRPGTAARGGGEP